MEVCRYNLNNLASNTSSLLLYERSSAMQEIVSGAAQNFQSLFSTGSGWQEVFDKKNMALFILNNNKLDPEVKSWMDSIDYSSSLFSSLGIMNAIEIIKSDKNLTTATKLTLEQWLKAEENYLPLAVALDDMRVNLLLKTLLGSESPLLKKISLRIMRTYDKTFPKNKNIINVVAQDIYEQLQKLTPKNLPIKILIGGPLHEVRLSISRNEDRTFCVTGFEPNSWMSTKKTVIQWPSLSAENLSLILWRKLLSKKITNDEDQSYEATLIDHFGKPSKKSLTPRGKKKQNINACPMHSLVNDLRYEIIRGAATFEEGLAQYKVVSALISRELFKKGDNDARFSSLIEGAVKQKELNIHWKQMSEVEVTKCIEGYAKAIADLGNEAEFKIAKESPVEERMTLLMKMDKKLSNLLKHEDNFNLNTKINKYFSAEQASYVCPKLRQRKKRVEGAMNSILSGPNAFRNNFRRSLIKLEKDYVQGGNTLIHPEVIDELWNLMRGEDPKRVLATMYASEWIFDNKKKPPPRELLKQLYENSIISNDLFAFSLYAFFAEPLPDEVKKNESFFNEMMEKHPNFYKYLPQDKKMDPSMAMKAVSEDLTNYQYVPEQLKKEKNAKNSKEFLIEMLDNNSDIFYPIPQTLIKDEAFILDFFSRLLNNKKYKIFTHYTYFISDTLKKNNRFLSKLHSINPKEMMGINGDFFRRVADSNLKLKIDCEKIINSASNDYVYSKTAKDNVHVAACYVIATFESGKKSEGSFVMQSKENSSIQSSDFNKTLKILGQEIISKGSDLGAYEDLRCVLFFRRSKEGMPQEYHQGYYHATAEEGIIDRECKSGDKDLALSTFLTLQELGFSESSFDPNL